MPAAKSPAFLEPIRLGADWIQDFALALDQATQAQNLTNVSATVDLVKRAVPGEEAQHYSVSTDDHVSIEAAAGVVAVRAPAAAIADYLPGVYDLSLKLTWPNDVIDEAFVAPIRIEQGIGA